MEEKKLTDEVVAEEIVKALVNTKKSLEDLHEDDDDYDKLSLIKKINNSSLWLIHSLQGENKRLSEKAVALEVETNNQKAEIERLTRENEYLDMCGKQFLADYQKCEIEIAELQKQVDELKEQIKQLTASCQSKNAKIKKLNAENEALKNELNAQNGKPHYRYIIWNTVQKKQQFPSICEMTENGAYTKLFQKIGWDSAKYRFVVKRIKVDGVEVE